MEELPTKTVISRFYLFGVVSVIVVVIGLFFQFIYNRNLIIDEMQKSTNLACELVKSEIEENLSIYNLKKICINPIN